jgi:hypothetical protein
MQAYTYDKQKKANVLSMSIIPSRDLIKKPCLNHLGYHSTDKCSCCRIMKQNPVLTCAVKQHGNINDTQCNKSYLGTVHPQKWNYWMALPISQAINIWVASRTKNFHPIIIITYTGYTRCRKCSPLYLVLLLSSTNLA